MKLTGVEVGQIAAILLLLFVSVELVRVGPLDSFYILHSINLVFHEAGHTIFGLFGTTIGFLGGMFGQLLVPLIVLVAFVRELNWFAVLVSLWWFGQNFVDLAPYIGDARSLQLPLIGGEHDFAYLLGEFNLLRYDEFFENIFMAIGFSIMFIALLLMSTLVYRTIKNRQSIIQSS